MRCIAQDAGVAGRNWEEAGLIPVMSFYSVVLRIQNVQKEATFPQQQENWSKMVLG